jgi:hypothetical protein
MLASQVGTYLWTRSDNRFSPTLSRTFRRRMSIMPTSALRRTRSSDSSHPRPKATEASRVRARNAGRVRAAKPVWPMTVPLSIAETVRYCPEGFVHLHPPAHRQEEAPPVFLEGDGISDSQRDKGAARREALDLLLWKRLQNDHQGQEPLLPLHRRALGHVGHGANVDRIARTICTHRRTTVRRRRALAGSRLAGPQPAGRAGVAEIYLHHTAPRKE